MVNARYLGLTANELAKVASDLDAENAKLRDLIFDILVDEERGHNDDGTYYEHVRLAKGLGIEVE